MIDWEMILSFIFALTALVTVLTFGTIAGKRNREFKLQKIEMEARIAEAKAAQTATADNSRADIEDRLRVLERIVTDPANNLSQQIEDLRAHKEGTN